MKKVLVFTMLFCFLAFTSAQLSMAQTIKYNWEKYGVSFSIPSTHQLKKSTADEFESGDNLTWLQMYPFQDASETAKGMIEKVAGEGGYVIESEGAYQSGGYDGYWVRCKSESYPEWMFWLVGFIDPNSPTNFYTIIWWKKGDQKAYKIAYDMSYSFKRMD